MPNSDSFRVVTTTQIWEGKSHPSSTRLADAAGDDAVLLMRFLIGMQLAFFLREIGKPRGKLLRRSSRNSRRYSPGGSGWRL